MPGIVAVNLDEALVLLEDGQSMHIVAWVDADGECDPDDAVAAVAGPDSAGLWYAIDLTEFEEAVVH